jgi:DNA-directed RNA polymerase specialized sigma24 family protein
MGTRAERDPFEVADPDLARELAALPPRQAAAITLRYLHGYSNREIAHALNVPERTVASRLAAARSRLQARLRPRDESSTFARRRVPSDR